MSGRPQDRLPADWPNRGVSRFVRAAGLNWHVQVMGSGPVMLMLHGTGAATHSWRDLMPSLARHFTVVAPDLPGHGFTEAPALRRLSLPGMAKALQSLLRTLDMQPDVAVGHSAGAAIVLRMCLDGMIQPRLAVGLNAALMPWGGAAGQVFSPLAKFLVGVPGVPQIFAWRARDMAMIQKLLSGTGSKIDARGAALYARVVREPSHAAAALGMMAYWDLNPLVRDLPRLVPKLLLIVGEGDRAIPPEGAAKVAAMVPGATVASLPGLGHLAHEEDPARTADLILAAAGP
jgi:magnesium chelatase accessory protein